MLYPIDVWMFGSPVWDGSRKDLSVRIYIDIDGSGAMESSNVQDRPPIWAHGNHTTYKTADDWGTGGWFVVVLNCFTHTIFISIWGFP